MSIYCRNWPDILQIRPKWYESKRVCPIQIKINIIDSPFKYLFPLEKGHFSKIDFKDPKEPLNLANRFFSHFFQFLFADQLKIVYVKKSQSKTNENQNVERKWEGDNTSIEYWKRIKRKEINLGCISSIICPDIRYIGRQMYIERQTQIDE